jgi:glucokinase
MILAGDIGGTKSLFGIYDGGEQLLCECRLANADFSSFEQVVAALLAQPDFSQMAIERVCFAVAGPIDDDGGGARLTNLGWQVDGPALAARFGLPAIRLINDFAAAALGAVTADSTQLHTLQLGAPLTAAPRLVIGAGTGLGMAIVLPETAGNTRWRVIPGEGGHIAFAPADDQQLALWQFLRRRYGRVTWERAVSGPGLAAIHSFVAGLDSDIDPGEIGRHGIAEPESTAGQALRLFVTLYGACAGDMALSVLPRGGVFLAGGIAEKIMPAMSSGDFVTAFNAKAQHSRLAERMPIHLVTDARLGLRGAALGAQT